MSNPEHRLVYAVAEAVADANRGHASLLDVTRAAIAAVQALECCSVCGCALRPPVLCDSCAASIAKNEVPA